jgi:very-short-patch-repair endonuclease
MDVTAALAEAGRSQGLLTPARLRALGVDRSALSRARADGDVVRVHRKVYAAAPLPALPRFVVGEKGVAPIYVAHVRAALLSLGDGAAACGRTAAALRGWGLLVEPSRTVEVAVPHGRGRARGKHLRIRQVRRLRRESVIVLAGTDSLSLTTAVQTVIDCCLSLPLVEAVVVCDSALRSGDVSMRELLRAARKQTGVRSARRVREVLRLADPLSGSVLESVLRCRLAQAGITRFETQCVLRDRDGRHVLRVDFCFGAARLVVETDGQKWHQDPLRDRSLDNALACLGFRVLRYTWAEVVHDHERVVADIVRALDPGSFDIHLVTQEAAAAA